MKIELKEDCTILFKDLIIGTVFIFNNNVYQKIKTLCEVRHHGAYINAVLLVNGRAAFFLDETRVKPIKGKFVEL